MLVLKAISHGYAGHSVLHELNLCVAQGEIVCLLGPSGCGKTTVLRIAAGFEPVQAGSVTIAGVEIARPGAGAPPEARPVGMVFQDYVLFPHLTVLQNVAFGITGVDAATRRARALARLDGVGLSALAERYPHTLSGGQQQRVALARALARDPAVLLLDEPFSGLDPVLRAAMRDETRAVLKQAGTATLLVTHDPAEAMALADRIAVLDSGRIVQDGTPETLWQQPATAEIAQMFGRAQAIPGVIVHDAAGDSWAETRLGLIAAPGFAPGQPVVAMVPADAIRLVAPSPGGAAAIVRDTRFVGHATLVLLSLDDAGTIRALVTGGPIPAPGERVGLVLAETRLPVFPARA